MDTNTYPYYSELVNSPAEMSDDDFTSQLMMSYLWTTNLSPDDRYHTDLKIFNQTIRKLMDLEQVDQLIKDAYHKSPELALQFVTAFVLGYMRGRRK